MQFDLKEMMKWDISFIPHLWNLIQTLMVTHPKLLLFPNLSLLAAHSAEHARNYYSSLLISYGNVNQPRPVGPGEWVSSLIETKQKKSWKRNDHSGFGLGCEDISSGFVTILFCLWGEKPENKRSEGTNLKEEGMERRKELEGLMISLSHLLVSSVNALLQNFCFMRQQIFKTRLVGFSVMCI